MSRASHATAMSCTRCGGRGVIPDGGTAKSTGKSTALRVVVRYRDCDACAHRWQTTEIDSAELADLRRKAFLHELAAAGGPKGNAP